MTSLDLIILSIPKMDLAAPYVGPALLKAVCQEQGFQVNCLDLNIELYCHIGESYKALWLEDSPAFEPQNFDLYQTQLFPNFVTTWVSKILSENPNYIGISCITFADREFSYRLAREIKKQSPKQKIIIGGTDSENRFRQLKSENLVDYFIPGDAEEGLLELLQGRHNKVENLRPVQRKSLDDLPLPDYSDFDFKKYSFDFYDCIRNSPLGKLDFPEQRMLYITSSRGCVRKCNFCDIGYYWKRYVHKRGRLVADEMYHQFQKHGIRYYYFTDSLINGDLKNLQEMCEQLISHQLRTGIKLYWRAQFIVLRKDLMPISFYQLLEKAGCDLIIVGVESGSESVRDDMNKKFKNEDFFALMDSCETAGIRTGLLFLVGYPSESEAQFEETLDLIRQSQHYQCIDYISIGHTLLIAPSTPLFQNSVAMNLSYTYFDSWECENNNLDVRFRRLLDLKKLCNELWFKLREPRTDFLKKQTELQQHYAIKIENSYLRRFQQQRTRTKLAISIQANKIRNLKLFLLHYKLISIVVKKCHPEDLAKLQFFDGHSNIFTQAIVTALIFLAKDLQSIYPSGLDEDYFSRLESWDTTSVQDAYRILFYIRTADLFKNLFEDLYRSDSESALQSSLLLCAAHCEDAVSSHWIDTYERVFGDWGAHEPRPQYEMALQFIEGNYFGN